MEIDYIKCLFCGYTQPLKSKRGEFKLRPIRVDPAKYYVVEFRSVNPGPGRGKKVKGEYGFKTVGGLNFSDALKDPRYRDLASDVKKRLLAILRAYLKAGVIKKSEVQRLLK